MKRIFIILFSILTLLNLYPQNKSRYDVEFKPNQLSKSASINNFISSLNYISEYTLSKEGYYTIGLNHGRGINNLDDSCQITFGHPYAMTSYPYFKINGDVKSPEIFFYNDFKELRKSEDTLILVNENQQVKFIFFINQASDYKIKVTALLINKENDTKNVDLGLVFDPALGKWGDGSIFLDDTYADYSKSLTSLPQNIQLWERNSLVKGIGISLEFPERYPDNMEINNWFDIFKNVPFKDNKLFDAAIAFESNKTLNQNDTISLSYIINILDPVFPNNLFMRAQLPQFLSIENNLLFPRQSSVLTEIYNKSTNSYSSSKLVLNGNDLVSPDESALFTIQPNSKTIKQINLNTKEVFEDKILPVKLDLVQNTALVDEITRDLFFPSSPKSDTGIVIKIDTVKTEFPAVEFVFTPSKTNGRFLPNLSSENIFLYENNQRINNFRFGKDTTGGVSQADIVFVFDVTGSMSDEIADVKNNIIEFVDSLSYRGVDVRLGMVTFLDVIENVYDFTNDVQAFRQIVADQYAHGGDDLPENSLGALLRATQFNFRQDAKKIFIWITDASYHSKDWCTPLVVEDVLSELLNKNILNHCIGTLQYQTEFYDPLVNPTGGNVYDINGNFRDILLDISRIQGSNRYYLKYLSSLTSPADLPIKLELHYAGLGGSIEFNGLSPQNIFLNQDRESIVCYPNPFNPSTTINISNPDKLAGEVSIFNILGQQVKTYKFDEGQNLLQLHWNAASDNQIPVSSGVYFLRLNLKESNGSNRILPVHKLMFIK